MDFLKNVGSMVGKGFDTLKTNIIKNQENQSNQPNNSLPKGVHILGTEDLTVTQDNYQNQPNANINVNSQNPMNKKLKGY